MKNNEILTNLGIIDIQNSQQNRYPLLFIDKIIAIEPGKTAHGIKNFSYNEWYFPAHFADDPNVPGFIQIECLAQTFIMTFLCMDEYKGKKTSFVSANNIKFKRKIIPGDQLDIYAELLSFRRGIAKGYVKSFVNDEEACSAEFVIAIPDILNSFKPKK